MVKNNIKKHYITEHHSLKGKKFRADRNSEEWHNGYDEYFDIEVLDVVGTVVTYRCMSNVDYYNNTVRTTTLNHSEKIIGRFWIEVK